MFPKTKLRVRVGSRLGIRELGLLGGFFVSLSFPNIIMTCVILLNLHISHILFNLNNMDAVITPEIPQAVLLSPVASLFAALLILLYTRMLLVTLRSGVQLSCSGR